MRFHYDKKKDALYMRFSENPYRESDEIDKGVIFDYDQSGNVIGIEILDASKKIAPSFRSRLTRRSLISPARAMARK